MQVRFSTCKGALVAEESSEEVLGLLVDVLIHPDSGRIEGFSVHAVGGQQQGVLFCSSADVLRFGARIYVRSADVLCDPYDIVRLHSLLQDTRRVLGQRVRTESGQYIGRCRDIQFNTETMTLEWIFPKGFLRWKRAIATSDILEVREDCIVVRDAPLVSVTEEDAVSVFDSLDVREPKVSRVPYETGR
ncbi:hypothetical protein COU76_00860 [Candidatus Peregrinibacteria bacterium CG10_big_fil_rev_8_21_14_0_10_49_10]|nr:MAG: hypothetical protein COU76_00860 [Candidatus Peregrinibacteria bacterium CG10_big_fil_rev_8_21_14_0_10_49_10]